MASEATVLESSGGATTEMTTAPVDKQPHKLERDWTFWFDNQSKPKQGAAWGSSLRKAYTFQTVQEFWWLSYRLSGEGGCGRCCTRLCCDRLVLLLLYPGRKSPSTPQIVFRANKLPANADFHLFKTGIEPKWEDPECANGGKWTVISSRKETLDTMWRETLMALIGKQFDEAEEICGVVVSVRQRQDKLALWTKNAANEAAQMSIGRKWKEFLDVPDKISYSFHDDSKRERSAKSQ